VKAGRVVAVDHGTKRIGTAVSDTSRTFAFPGQVFRNEEELIAHLKGLAAEGGLAAVVVGLPLNMDGTKGPRAEEVLAFCDRLRPAVAVEVVPWDERLSTVEAEELLRGAGARGERRKELIDAVAAQCILRSYLAFAGGSS
jgi:putative Holliday junction resolvase